MNIGNVIRTKRRAKDMTQEDLAEVLGVSVSAVSLWESGKTMPDMGLVPAICSVLEVSADELFGIDVENKQKIIEGIVDEAFKYSGRGFLDEAKKILEDGLKKYPDSYYLMYFLMYDESWSGNDERARELGEMILEKSTDETLRSGARQVLTTIYRDSGESEKAWNMIQKVASINVCREVLKTHIFKGNQAIEADQDLLVRVLDIISIQLGRNLSTDSGERQYSEDDMAEIWRKKISMFELFFEDGDYGFFHTRLEKAHSELADYYADRKDRENCLIHIAKAVHHAIEFVKFANSDGIERTSLLFRGNHCEGFSTGNQSNNALCEMESLAHERFGFIRDTDEFRQIFTDLEKYAGKWEREE